MAAWITLSGSMAGIEMRLACNEWMQAQGYSGTKGEVLTINAPSSAAGKTFNLTAAGKDTRSLQSITAYIPAKDSLQKIFLCATTAQVVANAPIGVNTPLPAYCRLKSTARAIPRWPV